MYLTNELNKVSDECNEITLNCSERIRKWQGGDLVSKYEIISNRSHFLCDSLTQLNLDKLNAEGKRKSSSTCRFCTICVIEILNRTEKNLKNYKFFDL